ncbi:hypothetical protein ID866_9633 [Astraeus odoratus]|nr:hypothetical protein ID866_9633 [Astraeus odoratus]
MTMTTHCQATLQAATSSHRRSSTVVVDQFRSFSACCALAALSHSQSLQYTLTPVPQSASAQATVLQTLTQPQTLSNPGNPGDPGDDDPDDGDNPFFGDDDKGEDDLQGNELTIDPNDHPLWMDNWREFVIELQTTFRPHNLVADAKHELDHLQMKENQCINKYVVEFNCIASQLQGYGDGALCHHFYTGLPDHIKDKICHVGKPRTLGELHLLAQEKASSNNSSAPNLSNKLGKDGKLTAAEHKRHFDLNLCMFCGGNGHFLNKCPKKEAKAKAHTAKAAESTLAAQSDSGPAPESKN